MTQNIPMLDVVNEEAPLRPEIDRAIARVLDSGRYIGGPEVQAFEAELATEASVQASVGVSSGTDALLVSLMALGIGPGDEVVTTPLSFFATAGVISRVGARPVFADVEDDSLNLDPANAASVCTDKTAAIITVQLYGRPAAVPQVSRADGSGDIAVVEDIAQSLCAAPVRGTCATVSFFPSKNVGALGDAGAVLTNDADLAETLRVLRNHGGKPKYYHAVIGGNFRLDALQAAVLRVKLPHLQASIGARRDNAAHYRSLFANASMPAEVRIPSAEDVYADGARHVYNQFVIRVPKRDSLREFLAADGISTAIYYPVPFHLQRCYADLGYRAGAFPIAEQAADEVLAIPVFPRLGRERQARIVDRIAMFYSR